MACRKFKRFLEKRNELDLESAEWQIKRTSQLKIAKLFNYSINDVEVSLSPELRRWAEPDVIPSIEYFVKKKGEPIAYRKVDYDSLLNEKLDDATVREMLKKEKGENKEYPLVQHSKNYRTNFNLDETLGRYGVGRAEVAGKIAEMRTLEGKILYPYNVELVGAYFKGESCRSPGNILIEYKISGVDKSPHNVRLDDLFSGGKK